jgi:predicted AAA+ superfamily ATPase
MKNRELYINKLIKYVDTPVIKIITGIRRCGKSYLLKLVSNFLIDKGIDENQIIKIDFESIVYEIYRDYKALYEYVINSGIDKSKKVYILIDEIQEVEEWEKAIRSFTVDLDCDIYLTGSNAHLLSSELATYLSGRYVELELYPLSFNEYIEFYELDSENKQQIEDSFYEYLMYGGFPGLYQLPNDDDLKVQYIKGIYNSVVLKDVIQRNKIRDVELLERVFVYIVDNIGQIFSAKKIADYLKNQGRKVGVESVYSYIHALENAMILYSAKRYDVKGKKILDRMEKYFLADLGLRYSMLGYRSNDISQLLENVVYLELRRRGYQVYVGKEGEREIDFIAEKMGAKLYIQVTYLLATNEVIEREYFPLTRINDNYRKIVVSLDRMPIGIRDGIEWMNIIDFIRTRE